MMINVVKAAIVSVLLSLVFPVPLSVKSTDEDGDGGGSETGGTSKINGECVTDSGPKSGQKCVFPFIFSGKMYSSCTEWLFDEKKSRKGQLWCSTSVDEFGRHQKGNYGFCSNSCKGFVSINSQDSKDLEASNDDETKITGFVFEEKLPGILDNPL